MWFCIVDLNASTNEIRRISINEILLSGINPIVVFTPLNGSTAMDMIVSLFRLDWILIVSFESCLVSKCAGHLTYPQVCFIVTSNQLELDATDYFRCVEAKASVPSNDSDGEVPVQSYQHHCIDYINGIPVFVRGTYAMVCT